MLKTIHTKQVRLGMFVQEMKGSWIDHPFWRKSFVLQDPEDLKKLRASKIQAVVIDTSKGIDVIEEPATPVNTPDPIPVVKPAVVVPAPLQKRAHRTTASEERAQAVKLLNASKAAVTSMFEEVRMGKAINAHDALPLVDEITASVSRNESALISLVRLKNKDDYTYMHSVAVCAMMVALARELELSAEETKEAGLAGLLHDIGKMAVPQEILDKPGALTPEEFEQVKLHPARGYELLQQASNVGEIALDVCLHHHEKIDGSGYPDQLGADQISVFAKMGAVCDVYDAITSNRPYKAGWEPGVSLQRMAKWSNHFDSVVFKAFVKSVGIYPIGSLVKLKSGRLAVVIDQSPKSLLTPVVKVFFSTKSKIRIPIEILDLSRPLAQDQIIGHEDPVLWGIHDVNELWSHSEL